MGVRRPCKLGSVQRIFAAVRLVEVVTLVLAMAGMAGVTVVNVVLRNLAGNGLAFAEELNQLLIVLVTFVGTSYAAGTGRHIRMSALSDAVPVRRRRWLLMGTAALTSVLLGAFAIFALRYALIVDRRSPVLDLPLGTVYLIAPLGLAAGAVQYALVAWRNARGPGAYVAFERLDPAGQTDGGA